MNIVEVLAFILVIGLMYVTVLTALALMLKSVESAGRLAQKPSIKLIGGEDALHYDARPDYKNNFMKYGRMTFNNIILDSPTGNTPHAEIDRIIITPYQIYCIEDKNYQGIIFGDKKSKKWTQCTYYRRTGIQNPIHQNYKHIRALEDLLRGHLKGPIQSYVVFKGAHKLNVVEDNVLLGDDALELKIASSGRVLYSLEELNAIARKLAMAEVVSPYLRPLHIQEVNEYLLARAA